MNEKQCQKFMNFHRSTGAGIALVVALLGIGGFSLYIDNAIYLLSFLAFLFIFNVIIQLTIEPRLEKFKTERLARDITKTSNDLQKVVDKTRKYYDLLTENDVDFILHKAKQNLNLKGEQ